MTSLINKLYFYTSLVSIILYPRVLGLLPVQYGLVLLNFLIFFIVSKKKFILSKYELYYIELALVFFCCSILGAVFSEGNSGMLTSFVFLLCFNITLFSVKYNFNEMLLRGFFFCAFFSSIYIIVDAFQFYFVWHEPLIWKILPATRDPAYVGRPHPFFELTTIAGILLYRPCGLSPDPGCSVTAITLAYVIYLEGFINIKRKKIYTIIPLLAILLSVSKTSIISLIFYFLIKKYSKYYIPYKKKKINLLAIIAVLEIIILFVIGLLRVYHGDQDGNGRHMKYFSSLIYTPLSNPLYFLFGYGFTNTGLFFDSYVPWLINGGKFRLSGYICESTLTNIFLYGGFIGSLFWVYIFFLILSSNSKKYLLVLDILIFLAFGYTISGSWFFFVVFSLSMNCVAKKRIIQK